ncbi:TRAF3-interacting protein 1 isoform X1 [Gracilinanus agilis]|uniref:TRAF3-interacting protein 1 isoform X1 n=1 Tax=Gracilinanus agilis TaxID=191870 RepID=UPI001CFDB483|nr:TRAF3-interacting protein 1 isoform X1 [Gracilinanus agilis]
MTGFMKGLYSDAEMKSDNVKDKDAKISFLQKTIDVVIMVSGEPLSVKPARIVAGHEPERTNELLQAIGKCCLNKLSSDDAVKRVLAGEKGDTKGKSPLTSKSQELDNKEFKEEDPRTHKEKEDRRNSEIKDRSTSRERKVKEESKDEESKARDKDREREKSKDGDRERHKDLERDKGKDLERDRNKNRVKQEREREKSRDKDRGNKDRELERDKERKSEGGKEKERLKERDREREREKERERAKDKDREKRKDRTKDGEHSREHEKDKIKEQERLEKKSTGTVENLSKKFSESPVKDTKLEMDKESDITNRVSRSLTSKGSRWRSKNSAEGRKEANNNSASVSDGSPAGVWHENTEPEPAAKLKGDSTSDAEGEVGVVSQEKPVMPENMEMSSELAAGIPQRRMPRPGSARPAPPRIKRQDSAEVLVPERTGSGKMVSNVIIDTQNSDDEEDSQFVVEAAPQLSEMPEMETAPAVELEEDEKHGGLVKKILETKKDYEKLQQVPKPTEKERPLLLEAAWKKEKDIVSKEIEKLRTSIQTLCRSALPLGKIMDYIQEDMDAMQNELQVWHSENKQHAEALQKEQSITDCAVEPLKAELVELEQLIKDQQDKICAVKANILKNEEKIQKMVYSINISSRR